MHRALKIAALAATLLTPVAAQAADGDCGTIVMPVGGGDGPSADLTSFSPIFSDTAYNATASLLLYPALLWINRYSQIDWQRSMASSVTTTDDQSFTVTLKPWNWSDGVPVTAEDVAYGWNLIKKLGPTWPGYGEGGLPDIVQAFTVLSPTQFSITTKHKVNPEWFIYNAISGFSPLPEHAWKQYSLDQLLQLQSTPSLYNVVAGPLKLESFTVGQDAVFVPNPAWPGPKMHFERLVFSFLQGDGPGVQAAESGDVDVADAPNDIYPALTHLPGLHIEILQQPFIFDEINLNFKNPKDSFFHDVRVRQAIVDAIDQQTIVKTMEHGHGDAAYGPVPQSQSGFLAPDMRKGIYPVGYDPEKSRALLDEAGWKPGPGGIRVKDGKRLSFTYLEAAGSNSNQETDEFIQQALQKIGVEMKIRTVDFNQMIQLMSTQPDKWDATGTGQPSGSYPSGEFLYATGAFENMGGYSDPKMDQLIEASVNQPGNQALFDYETYVSTQVPVIFIPRTRPAALVSNRLHGWAEFLNPVGMMSPDMLYCSPGTEK